MKFIKKRFFIISLLLFIVFFCYGCKNNKSTNNISNEQHNNFNNNKNNNTNKNSELNDTTKNLSNNENILLNNQNHINSTNSVENIQNHNSIVNNVVSNQTNNTQNSNENSNLNENNQTENNSTVNSENNSNNSINNCNSINVIKRITPPDKPSQRDPDNWGVSISEKYVTWQYTLNTNNDQPTASILIYDITNCILSDPFEEMMNPPDGFNMIAYVSPRISTDKIVYQKILWNIGETNHAHRQIFVKDLSTNENKMISTEEGETSDDKTYPDIHGNFVVWADWRNNIIGINIYNLLNSENRYIATEIPGGKQFITVWGDYVSWLGCLDGPDYCDIYMYQISTDTITNITQSGGYEGEHIVTVFPVTKHNKVVWSDGRNSDEEISVGYAKNYDIYLYDILTQQETQLTNTDYQEIKPWVSERYVAYLDGQGVTDRDWYIRQADLIVIDMETNKRIRFLKGNMASAGRCNSYQAPRIEGDFLVVRHLGLCERYNRDTNSGDLYLINLKEINWNEETISLPIN